MSEEQMRAAAWDLVSNDIEIQQIACRTIKEYGGKAARVVLEVAHEWDEADQKRLLVANPGRGPAYDLVKAIRGVEAIDALAEFMCDSDPFFRVYIVYLLAGLVDPCIQDLMVKAYYDVDARVRVEAVSGLGNFGDQRSHDLIVGALNDPEDDVRLRAVREMRHMAGVEGVGILIQMLQDPSEQVVYKVISALRRLFAEEAIEPIIGLLNSEAIDIVENSIYALGKMGDPRAVEPIKRIVQSDAVGRTKMYALEALVELDPKSAAGIGASLLEHNERYIRYGAEEILDKPEQPETVQPLYQPAFEVLLEKLKSDVVSTQCDGVEALGKTRNPLAVKPLTDMLTYASDIPRLMDKLLNALALIGNEEAISILATFMYEGGKYAFRIAKCLADMGYEPGLEYLCNMMENDIEKAYLGTLVHIGRINHPRIIKLLVSMLEHPTSRIKVAAIYQLCESTDPTVEHMTQPFLQDPDYRIQTAALIALNERKIRQRMAEFRAQTG